MCLGYSGDGVCILGGVQDLFLLIQKLAQWIVWSTIEILNAYLNNWVMALPRELEDMKVEMCVSAIDNKQIGLIAILQYAPGIIVSLLDARIVCQNSHNAPSYLILNATYPSVIP